MGRPKDEHYWNQVTKEENGTLKCKHCGHKFKGGVSRIKAHVDRIQGQGISVCSINHDNGIHNCIASCSNDPQGVANAMNPMEGWALVHAVTRSGNSAFGSNVSHLNELLHDLTCEEGDIKGQLEWLESRGKKCRRQVDIWLNQVQRLKNKAVHIKSGLEIQQCSEEYSVDLGLNYGRETQQLTEEVRKHKAEKPVVECLVIPLVPRHLSNRAYRLSFLGTTCSSLYSLYSQYGKPRAWNMQALQVYFQSIIATKDFIVFIYCLSFVTSHLCLKFALIPIICRASEHVAKFLRRNFSRSTLYRKYLEEPCVWVESNNTTLNILTSHAEIGLGFLLIISLFSWQRNIIQTFMYWQLLKLMYQAPVTAAYHQSVWAKVGRTANPFIHQYAPFLNTPISAVQRWWLR